MLGLNGVLACVILSVSVTYKEVEIYMAKKAKIGKFAQKKVKKAYEAPKLMKEGNLRLFIASMC